MKYPKPEETDDTGWTQWIQPIRRGYRIKCCDCGLIHKFNFRMRKRRIQYQAARDDRATGQVRRHAKKD